MQIYESHLLTSFPGITPPYNPTSIHNCPRAELIFSFKLFTVVVGGMEFRGISTIVPQPPGNDHFSLSFDDPTCGSRG
jgi:hypothetical protein